MAKTKTMPVTGTLLPMNNDDCRDIGIKIREHKTNDISTEDLIRFAARCAGKIKICQDLGEGAQRIIQSRMESNEGLIKELKSLPAGTTSRGEVDTFTVESEDFGYEEINEKGEKVAKPGIVLISVSNPTTVETKIGKISDIIHETLKLEEITPIPGGFTVRYSTPNADFCVSDLNLVSFEVKVQTKPVINAHSTGELRKHWPVLDTEITSTPTTYHKIGVAALSKK